MPFPTDPSDMPAEVHRLRRQIDQLTRLQTEALETAIYVSMTAAEVKAFDDRHGEILGLIQQLAELEKTL
ncbi:MAG: hypothetical protein WAM79_18455 [Candidatus Sulfotelmatobacter sp.]